MEVERRKESERPAKITGLSWPGVRRVSCMCGKCQRTVGPAADFDKKQKRLVRRPAFFAGVCALLGGEEAGTWETTCEMPR